MVDNLSIVSVLGFIILFSCNSKVKNVKPSIEIDKNLEKVIVKYIDKYNISPPCMLNVGLVCYQYNYKAFNISTDFSRDYKFSSLCLKSKNRVDVCFYSGIENYFNNQDNRLRNVNKNCVEAGIMVVIDSAGFWSSYDNIGLFPNCDLPDINDLLSKANKE